MNPKNLGRIKMSYYTIGEIDNVQQMIQTYRKSNDNPYLADYTLRATMIDENGNEYPFVHSHNRDHLHGRPLPQDVRDCPRPGSEIDPSTGECTDKCTSNHDCALGYSCGSRGQCLREKCSKDSECSSKKCGKGVCEVIKCSNERRVDFPTGFYVAQGVNDPFVAAPYQPDRCVSTSHYHLKGRDSIQDISGDPRFNGMYR